MTKYVASTIIITFFAGNLVMAQGRSATNPPNSRGSTNSHRPASAGQTQHQSRPSLLDQTRSPSRPSSQSTSGREIDARTGILSDRSRQSKGMSGQKRLDKGSRSIRRDSERGLRSRPNGNKKQDRLLGSNGATQRNPLTRVTGRERALQQQIANIDRMRDKALESGSIELLERADAMEQAARKRFDMHNEKQSDQIDRKSETRDTRTRNNRLRTQRDVADSEILDSDDNGQGMGREISKIAKILKRDFGQTTAESARTLGQEFGRSNADKTRPRIYDSLLPETRTDMLPELDPRVVEQPETKESPTTNPSNSGSVQEKE